MSTKKDVYESGMPRHLRFNYVILEAVAEYTKARQAWHAAKRRLLKPLSFTERTAAEIAHDEAAARVANSKFHLDDALDAAAEDT